MHAIMPCPRTEERVSVEYSHSRSGARQVPVVHANGDLDIATVDSLRDEVAEILAERPPALVIDLTGVAFFDSSGLHALDEIRRTAEEQGTTLGLICPHARLMKLFEITDLKDLFEFYPSADAAGDAIDARG